MNIFKEGNNIIIWPNMSRIKMLKIIKIKINKDRLKKKKPLYSFKEGKKLKYYLMNKMIYSFTEVNFIIFNEK